MTGQEAMSVGDALIYLENVSMDKAPLVLLGYLLGLVPVSSPDVWLDAPPPQATHHTSSGGGQSVISLGKKEQSPVRTLASCPCRVPYNDSWLPGTATILAPALTGQAFQPQLLGGVCVNSVCCWGFIISILLGVVCMFYLWSSLAVLLCVSGASAFLVGTKLPATAQAQPRNMCTPLEAVPFKVSRCLCACIHMAVNAC
jgi:hypothetical protein